MYTEAKQLQNYTDSRLQDQYIILDDIQPEDGCGDLNESQTIPYRNSRAQPKSKENKD